VIFRYVLAWRRSPEDTVLTPADQWHDPAAPGPVRELLYRAKLLGTDIRVVNPGGGNFSVKDRVADHLGRRREVMWISGWGCDGGVLTEGELACLRVADIRVARSRPALCDSSMFAFLSHCATTNGQPHPAIETLLHAYLAAPHVDHTHPEAVIALTAVDGGRELAGQVFGEEAIWCDYEQFSPELARQLAGIIEERPAARFVLLANHGMLTWGRSSRECYRNTIEAARRAAAALEAARKRPCDLGGQAVRPLAGPDAEGYLTGVLPVIRGELSRPGARMVLTIDRDPSAVAFACSRRGPELSLIGPACPDSLVKMKRLPVILPAAGDGAAGDGQARRAAALAAIAGYRQDYLAYWRQHAGEPGGQPPAGADLPRVFVIPGVGVVSAGEDAAAAGLAEAHYRQTRRVVTVCDSVGGYSSLAPAQAWQDEYWPLLREKPQLRPPRGRLAGHIVLLAAGADGVLPDGLIAGLSRALLAEDAHVVVAGAAAGSGLAGELRAGGTGEEALNGRLARCPDGDPVRGAVLAYGGLDIVVHLSAGPRAAQDLAARAGQVFAAQGWPGCYIAAAACAVSGAAIIAAARGAVDPHVVVLPEDDGAERQALALGSVITLATAGVSAPDVLGAGAA
jgi:rhamnose utilization protein RhaD (predicted bifunctional aldolase and dehydrogenase)